MSKKALITTLGIVLVVALAVGGTLAYLHSVTDWYTNTFEFAQGLTVTVVDSGSPYKIVPGKTQSKAATISVTNDIDCYLYLIIEDDNTTINNKTIVDWSVADGWTSMDYSVPGGDLVNQTILTDSNTSENTHIYYRTVAAGDGSAAATFHILNGDQVSYPLGITSGDIPGGTTISLKFAGVAIQQEGFGNALAAWKGEALPAATLETLDTSSISVSDLNGTGTYTGPLDTAVQFTAPATVEGSESVYDNWTCDFVLSFNKDVDKSKIHLFGSYELNDGGAWFGGPLGASDQNLTANTGIRLLRDWLSQVISGLEGVPYSEVQTLNTFKCGIAVPDETTKSGLVATLQLVMIDPADNTNVVVISEQVLPIG